MGMTKEILNIRRGRQGFRTLCCDVFGLLKNQFLRNNKGSRSNVNKHELVNCESSIILLKKTEKVKDFSFIRKGPYYRDIFNQIPPSPKMSVYYLYYCLQSLLLILRKNQFISPKMSQQNERNPYRPLLLILLVPDRLDIYRHLANLYYETSKGKI